MCARVSTLDGISAWMGVLHLPIPCLYVYTPENRNSVVNSIPALIDISSTRYMYMYTTRREYSHTCTCTMVPPAGIPNLHNTCFAAAVLQLLRAIGIHCELPAALAQVAARFPYFHNHHQHDAHEWLVHLLDILYPGSNTKSPFDGVWKVSTQCVDCAHSREQRETFRVLSTTPGQYHTGNLSDGETTAVHATCDHCQDSRAHQRTTNVYQWPRYLFLHIQRSDSTATKIDTAIEVAPTCGGGVYSTMVGFICHRGATVYSGHYVAYVQYEHQWYCCDDARVVPVSTVKIVQYVQQAYIILWIR